MLAIEVTFLTGRYHATPWDRHVNEGVAEWPPSPWRLLRALVASWRRHFPELEPEQVEEVLRALTPPPEYSLPVWAGGHLRHYVPVPTEKRLMLDAFIQVQGPLVMVWPSTLPDPQVLDRLLSGVSYLGRAESWCSLRRVQGEFELHATLQGTGENVALLCASPEVEIPQLEIETATMRKAGMVLPQGARWVNYRVRRPLPAEPAQDDCAIYRAEYLVRGATTLRRSQLLSVAELARRALLSLSEEPSAALHGKLEGEARADGHCHLHVLPQGPSESEVLDRLVVWTPEGLKGRDREALGKLTRLELGGGESVRLVLWSLDLTEERARIWESYTPFLMARHAKPNGKDSPEDQLRRECQLRGLPPVEVTSLGPDPRRYHTARRGRKQPPGAPLRMRLQFSQEVTGPLSLGAHAHFGMGHFVPAG